jgi:hypothetical protein
MYNNQQETPYKNNFNGGGKSLLNSNGAAVHPLTGYMSSRGELIPLAWHGLKCFSGRIYSAR